MENTTNIIPLVPPGKVRCFITGILRADTPEENVRQRWARSLADEYGYSKSDIGINVRIKMGRANKYADIVIYQHAAVHNQKEIIVIVETKRDDKKAGDKKDGDNQLISYMSACPKCRFGCWIGEDRRAYIKRQDGTIERITDIPRAGEEQPRKPLRADLRVVNELTSIFRRCHNYIHANSGLQKAEAFHEMLKLIFCKTYDEEEGRDELEFSIDPSEQRSQAGQYRLLNERLSPIFKDVKSRYPYIFDNDEAIKLDPPILAYIVGELQYISLLNSRTDVKGEAYETLVGANLRGDRGEYFTPRNVCDMTVRIIMSMYAEEDLNKLKVIDCCCGTGGFLVSWIDNLRKYFRSQEQRRHSKNIEANVRNRIRENCSRNLYGTDINPQLVRTSQMNLVMQGDGSTNVFKVNSLKPIGEWNEEARLRIPYGDFDIVLTNPPFGTEVKVDDPHILDRYELASWETATRRAAMPAEQLFVEAAMNFVKPGGIVGLVLPDGILNNPGLRFLRSWLLKRGKIIASIALPKETFGRNKGVNNPSVLLLQKYTDEERLNADRNIFDLQHPVFMAMPKTSGIDKRGNAIFLRHPDGQHILDSNEMKILDDEISEVPLHFLRFQKRIHS